MKTLLIYYSFSGNNEIIAEELQNKLECDLYKIKELKRRTKFSIILDIMFNRGTRIQQPELNLQQYDHIILMAPIWTGKLATPMRAFLELERDFIKEYSFITVCGGALGGNKKIAGELSGLLSSEPVSLLELKVNDLLPDDQKGKIKYTTGYRLQEQDVRAFDKEIRSFLQVVAGSVAV